MSELILIRHGQATPFEKDTDRLSPLGEQQARAVGLALGAEELAPTHVFHGPLVRQRRTAQIAADAAQFSDADAPPPWPDAAEDPRLAEYDGDGLIRTLAPLLAAQDEGFGAAVQRFEDRRDAPDRNRAFQPMLEKLAEAWQEGAVTDPDVESWAAFRSRVHAALTDLTRLPSGSTVLAFTSGGVIGLMVALALDAPDAAALKLNWRVRNGSLTRFTFGGGRLSLDSFNEVAHLPPALRSWR
ncbi:histidine phosphatase family protein [Deinococcus arenicola]|uniref:Histidine phosphatase family protein n=1 Tax=Deinococcus arenicola TaxID=2994950 RepID=A0ABU4DTS5_9DEIO|nr:histidine phosphatase family protein [Deinococcus sp. ZS9-10]MDV6375479.1 histidine phosphatase family protein [Deinococcus sp. ZS9-10]